MRAEESSFMFWLDSAKWSELSLICGADEWWEMLHGWLSAISRELQAFLIMMMIFIMIMMIMMLNATFDNIEDNLDFKVKMKKDGYYPPENVKSFKDLL